MFSCHSQDELKKQAAWKAVDYVKSDMVVGLGTGSTAAFAVDRLGQLLKEGKLKNIIGVPTSIRTYEQAKLEAFAANSRVPVINGLTNEYHPCQILADIVTYIEQRGSIQGKVVAWVGDGNNMLVYLL